MEDDDAAPESEGSPEEVVPQPGRPIIVKFLSRRIKNRVMSSETRRNLRGYNPRSGPVFVCDDLTKRRANMAYQARGLKRDGCIKDTWIDDCKILVKDNYNRIQPINKESDLDKYRRNGPRHDITD